VIAASVRRIENPVGALLIGVDPQNGRQTVISNAQWWALAALEWLPDGSGIVAVATRQGAAHDYINLAGTQIWLIPYPSGEPRRITNDASIYREPSISADGTKLVAVAANQANVHLSRVALGSDGPPERISTGRYDGVVGVTELADGRIVFTSGERGAATLWIMEHDGTGRRQLSRDTFENRFPVSFTGGIAYVSTSPAETDVCFINEDGESRRVIVRQVESAPIAVSPNGKSIVYSLNRRLWMISSDGAGRRQLTQEIASNPSFSPRGDRIAFVSGDTEQPEGGRLVVTNAAGDKILWSAPVPRQGGSLRWLPDGNSLVLYNFDTHNISIYPLRGQPKRLMHFDDFVWAFDVAHDGKSLLVAQGLLARDAVLITGFR
jgi:Tol biopolymer transport system component